MQIIGDKIKWININEPTAKDVAFLKKNFRFHPIVLEEILDLSARPKVEVFDDYLYFIYYFPIYNHKEQTSHRAEIDFLITKKEVITVHYEDLEPLKDFQKKLDESEFKKEAFGQTFKLVYFILKELIDFSERQLRHINEKLEEISKTLFRGRERITLEKISYLKRDISTYRIIVRPQETTLQSLMSKIQNFWPEIKESRIYFNDLIGDQLKILHRIDDYHEAISDYETTNSQLLSLKIDRAMQVFTILAFSTFPLMLFSALFSMNTKDTPIVGASGDFWIIASIMLVAVVAMFIYYKKKEWL